MDYIDWFLNVKLALHSWDKTFLVMVYTPFCIWLDCVSKNVLIFLCLHSWRILICSFLVYFLWLARVSELWWVHKMFWKYFLVFKYLKSFYYISIMFCLNIWQESSTKPSGFQIFVVVKLLIINSFCLIYIG